MQSTFQRKPGKAYGYAILDAILTLLVEERMRAEDLKMYQTLGFADDQIPPLRATQGSRVVEMITKSIAKNAAVGSIHLSRKGHRLKDGSVGKVAMARVKNLLSKGSGDLIADERLSNFGKQTGETHGGLLFSRSPTKFFHDGPGQFRDVDLSGCYASIVGTMNLYVGRPVIHEPGPGRMRLKDAVAFLREHAAGKDAWLVKVSGRITQAPNVLIPSTNGALTHRNYQNRAARKRAKSRRQGFLFDWLYEARKMTGNATLFTDVIEAGMVAWPTWLMIQALPDALRTEYENLEVETILFYPAKMVACDGPEYDALFDRFTSAAAPWTEILEMDRMRQVVEKQLDSDYVSLRYGIGELAQQISQFRQVAKDKYGKGSGSEVAWKLHANSMCGVAASRYLVTNNVVCANFITATARALAYAMQMSLNGIQVITDGCTYRQDQVPAGTFADCLTASAEYPIRRIEQGIEFVAPSSIPDDNKEYTVWYRQHAKQFFGVDGTDYDWLFGIHELEHKKCGEPAQIAFDGLCCDGSGNYMKLLRQGDTWTIADFKARSYSPEEKAQLGPWLLETYSRDNYTGPPPITESGSLLSYRDAVRVGRMALETLERDRSKEDQDEDPIRVYFPLGLDQRKFHAYKVIKASAYLFRSPEQRTKIRKSLAKFSEAHACGLEVLALRRGYGGRHKGSIVDIAEAIFSMIQAGGDNLTRVLNLTRDFKELECLQKDHFLALEKRKAAARLKLYQSIDSERLADEAILTGLFAQMLDIIDLE